MLHNIHFRHTLLILFSIPSFNSQAEWSARFDNNLFYTDDIGLFSVTRRLSLEQDPTQPVVDEPDQGSDFVYEPSAIIAWTAHNHFGEYELTFDAGGYVFFEQTAYTHGFYELKFSQALHTATKVELFYDFVPDLFLGKNEIADLHGAETEQDERLTSHIWSIHLNQKIADNLAIRLLARYGLRDYDQPFTHRDTNFWTIGPHIEWTITPSIELLIGYHYEQGSADRHQNALLNDDISYVNHYASTELKIEVLPQLILNLIFDYEHNNFTSNYVDDIHHGAYENIYQGELELVYEINASATVKLNWQHGNRKFNYEEHEVKNNNIGLGFEYLF